MKKELSNVRVFEVTVTDGFGKHGPYLIVDDDKEKASVQMSRSGAKAEAKYVGWATVEYYGGAPDFLVKAPNGVEVVISDEHASSWYMRNKYATQLRKIAMDREDC